MTNKGILLPIAAPSGTGKTTVCRELLKSIGNCEFSVSCTTRSPRPGEMDGVDYNFLGHNTFERYIDNGKFVEYEKVFENYYGTLKSIVDKAIKNKKLLLLDIDVKGALAIKKQYPYYTISVFLQPPSVDELILRLTNRGTENQRSIAIRKARIPEEMKQAKLFDYEIINDNLQKAVNKILDIIKEK